MTALTDDPTDDLRDRTDPTDPTDLRLAEVCRRVPERLDVDLPRDAVALVCSDLHLRPRADAETHLAARELAARLAAWEGPGAVVLNGDTFDLWAEPDADVASVLDAHPALARALREFAAGAGRHVAVVVGNHDARLAWDAGESGTVAARLGARCALGVDLRFDTHAGPRVVRCEHGHAFDPANALADPRSPLDSPLGQHVVQEVLPRLGGVPLLEGLPALTDPNAAGRLLVSRFVYRWLWHRAWWLLLPLLVALPLRLPLVVRLLSHSGRFGHARRWVLVSGAGLLLDVAVPVGLALVLAHSLSVAVSRLRLDPLGAHGNDAARTAAGSLCAAGLAGLVTGHTHQPELTPVTGGFYANSGCAGRCLEAAPAHWGLPPVFTPVLRRSWVELDVDCDVRARLVVAETPVGERTLAERLAARRRPERPATPEVVAVVPGHVRWPLREAELDRRARAERVRQVASGAVVGVALLNLVSSLAPFGRLSGWLRTPGVAEMMPVGIPDTAGIATATLVELSVALLLLARGLRRGHRLAWLVAAGLLVLTSALRVLRQPDLDVLPVLAVTGWLVGRRRAFPVRAGSLELRRAALAGAGTLLVAAGTVVALTLSPSRPPAGTALRAVLAHLAGDSAVPLPPGAPFVTRVLVAGPLLLALTGWLLTRPRLARRPTAAERHADLAKARRAVVEHGGDTLSYFALRDDKRWFFTGDCVVAYAVRGGVCLVSPDPVGPPEQWAAAWAEFTSFADRQGWPVCVVGASEGWQSVYAAAGMRSVYLGDEAVVDCTSFSLEGRQMRGLRQAYHRVQRAGYTVRFHDPAALAPSLEAELRALMTQSRRGGVERGFSMTLSRVFDPDDTGLLLAVAYAPDGRAAAFCHWVPARDIAGWSLDLMRRTRDPDVPNGLTDFVVLETIRYARARGHWGLGLNFAVLRGVLAGERGDGVVTDLERRVLLRFSETMQIESLWRFNQKYKPLWRPRFVMLGGLSTAALQGLAIADAEGVTELPVIGRLVGRLPGGRGGRGDPRNGGLVA